MIVCVVEWDQWRHMWMRMSGLRECEIETREWETTRRDESEIEWYKWWKEKQDIHGGVECLYDVFECWYLDQTWDVLRLMWKQTLWNIIQTMLALLWNEEHIIVWISSQNVCFVSCPVVSIQTDNCRNDEIGTMLRSDELSDWWMRINECGVMRWFVLWSPCWPDMIQMDEFELSECWWCFLGIMCFESTLIYETLWVWNWWVVWEKWFQHHLPCDLKHNDLLFALEPFLNHVVWRECAHFPFPSTPLLVCCGVSCCLHSHVSFVCCFHDI